MNPDLIVVGAGLAGSEAAWQAAERGVRVLLYEMRPQAMTPAHRTGDFAELVCSNSFGSNLADRAMGLLKYELRRLGSLVLRCADAHAVPAGGALAVSRDDFSRAVTQAIAAHPNVLICREAISEIPAAWPVIIATGPLTSQPLADAIQRLTGSEHLHFYDAMAPIVTAESVDLEIAFSAGRSSRRRPGALPDEDARGDYLNCPLSRDEYYAFVDALNSAEKALPRDFEVEEAAHHYFEGCLPIEVLAGRHPDALAYGPMRPVGLRDPRTGRRPFAVVQLRQDDVSGAMLNVVGFQTGLKWGEQDRVLRMIPGLRQVEFVRYGQMHRNTFLDSPAILRPTLQWRGRDELFFAGQITGTEGYLGAVAGGLLAGINASRCIQREAPLVLPETTMMGALFHYITHAEASRFQPMKANFGLLPPLAMPVRGKRERAAALAGRALADLEAIAATA